MNKSGRVLTVLVVLLALFSTIGCNKLRARDQLNKGVQSYKNAKYEDAIEHFKNAVELDPSLITARLYLATAYAQQYIPGADSPDNNRYAEQAIEVFKQVLAQNPPKEQQIHSLKGIASLYFGRRSSIRPRSITRRSLSWIPTIRKATIRWRSSTGCRPTSPTRPRVPAGHEADGRTEGQEGLHRPEGRRTSRGSKTVFRTCRRRCSFVPITTTPWPT